MSAPSPPFAAVLRLVWASLTVRIGRHLITALSVLLAVAFLVDIAGECVATRTVALIDAAERRAADQVQALRAAIVRPRDTTELLAQCRRDPDGTRRWLQHLTGDPAPVIDAEAIGQVLTLLHWLDDLPIGRAWLVTRNDRHAEWVLSLDASGRLTSLMAILADVPGLRPSLTLAALTTVVERLPSIRALLERCVVAEHKRIERLMEEGGVAERLERLEHHAGLADDALLPVSLILADWRVDDLLALQDQLRRERLRTAAQEVLAQQARRDPAAIDAAAIDDWSSVLRSLQTAVAQGRGIVAVLKAHDPADALAVERIARAIAGDALAREAILTVFDAALIDTDCAAPSLWQGRMLPIEVERLMGQDGATLAPRIRTRLNRLLLGVAFPGISTPLAPVPSAIEQVDDAGEAGQAARVALRLVLGADDAAAVVAEQTRRERRARLAAAFTARGGDPFLPDARRVALAALALLVCAVGVVNALLMAIHERFREIATMKCLGARDAFIVHAVLWEAAAVGFVGATLGAVLGVVAVVMQAGSRYGEAFWSAPPHGHLLLVAMGGVAIGIGLALVGALIPARIAARMPPVAALRVEA